jgi:hypothetical protein
MNDSKGGYLLRVVSFEDETYSLKYFNFPLEVSVTPDENCFIKEGVVDPELCGGSTSFRSNYSSVLFKIPFSPGAKNYQIFNPEMILILEGDLSEFSCGNSVCEDHENLFNCFEDCSSFALFSRSFLVYILLNL